MWLLLVSKIRCFSLQGGRALGRATKPQKQHPQILGTKYQLVKCTSVSAAHATLEGEAAGERCFKWLQLVCSHWVGRNPAPWPCNARTLPDTQGTVYGAHHSVPCDTRMFQVAGLHCAGTRYARILSWFRLARIPRRILRHCFCLSVPCNLSWPLRANQESNGQLHTIWLSCFAFKSQV